MQRPDQGLGLGTLMTDLAAGVPLRLAGAPLVVVTRFSFLGRSGWKSDVSRDAALLFDPERLRLRLELFRTITLPSLAAQTDRDFTHVILTSTRLPAWALAEVKEACATAYGTDGQFVILARRPGLSAVFLRRYLQSVAEPGALVAQAVLDDDDGLAVDFVADLRKELAALDAKGRDTGPGSLAFVSFPEGYGFEVGISEAGQPTTGVYAHRYPFINCGLTLVGVPGAANILGIEHRKTPLLHDPVQVRGKRMFLRSVHGMNDSRVARTERWRPVDPWREDPDIRARFPWLLDAGAFWNMG
jgi:hypothetical protein